jgi:SSS family solute:Na+ symporter
VNRDAVVSIGILALFLVATVALGLRAVRRREHNMIEWSVGGRSMGLLLTWVLMAGETYTSFSYLGAAGWSYTNGISALYVVAYLSVGMAVTYLSGPLLWSYAHRHGLHSISDLVGHRFSSPLAGAVVAVFATIFILPYVQLQITGMGVVVATISYGTISLGVAYLLAFLVSEAFVLVSGLRGSAWVSALKDALVVLTLLVVFVWVPVHYFGGYGELLVRMSATHSAWLTLPGPANRELGVGWFISTSALNAVVYSIFPTSVAGFLGARSPQILRQNAVVLPFYQLLLFVPVLLGFASVLVVPGLKDSNLALFTLITHTLPAWLLGVVGAAAALSSIVPMAVFMLVIGTMWTRSMPRWGGGERDERAQRRFAQLITLLTGVVALAMTYLLPNALVRLSVLSYEGIAQLLPMTLLALLWRRLSLVAGLCGLVVGVLVDVTLVLLGRDPLGGINAGLIGLAANLLTAAMVTRLRPADTPDELLAMPEPRVPLAAGH